MLTDAVHFEEVSGDVRLRPLPLPLLYPVVTDVRDAVVYGYDGQFTGTNTGLTSAPPLPPSLSVTDNEDGTGAVATVSGVTQTAEVWVAPVHDSRMRFSLKGSRSGAGEVGLSLPLGGYVAIAFCKVASGSGDMPGNPSEPLFFQVSNGIDLTMRDAMAEGELEILQAVKGQLVTFQNGESADAWPVWVSITDGDDTIQLRRRAATGDQSLRLFVPRQPGFPPGEDPEAFQPGSFFVIDSIVWEVDGVRRRGGTVFTSHGFDVSVSRHRQGNY